MDTPSFPRWQFWIDRGGTFTDIVAKHPQGYLLTHKLLSDHPKQYPDAAIQGIRNILGLTPHDALPTQHIATVKMGTTVATNALLERQGEPTALVISKGFKDALQIAYQNRPELFALQILLPPLLYQQVIEIDERVTAQGEVLKPVSLQEAKTALLALYQQGFSSIAIVLMHAYRYPQHEQQLAALACEIGFHQISVSHEVSPLLKLIRRGETTVVDAYLSPVLHRYVDQMLHSFEQVEVLFMQSHGGLAKAKNFRGKDAILSGPAGGYVGAVKTSIFAGLHKIINFDMGGTSTERMFHTMLANMNETLRPKSLVRGFVFP